MFSKYLDPKNDVAFNTELLSYDQAEKYEGAYIASMAQKFDEGKLERSFEIARDLLKKKYDVKSISDITGLSIDQINTFL